MPYVVPMLVAFVLALVTRRSLLVLFASLLKMPHSCLFGCVFRVTRAEIRALIGLAESIEGELDKERVAKVELGQGP